MEVAMSLVGVQIYNHMENISALLCETEDVHTE